MERFVALGTEPFWNAKVSPGTIVYSTPENQAGEWIAVAPTADGAVRVFTGTRGGYPFVLRLSQQTCSDGMSDRSYRFAAELKVGGENRQGCAEPGFAFKPE